MSSGTRVRASIVEAARLKLDMLRFRPLWRWNMIFLVKISRGVAPFVEKVLDINEYVKYVAPVVHK